MIIERLAKINSTNEYIKKFIPKRVDAMVVADEQTAGTGTKGRSFISQKGGLYVSKLTFHDNLPAQKSYKVMMESAMAVVKTLLAFNVEAKIKWPNDIIVNGRKICGILIHNVFSGDLVDYSVIGIGVNVNNDLAEEISSIAISVKQVLGREIDLNSFLFSLMLNFSTPVSVEDYKAYSLVLGKTITVTRGDESYSAVAVDVREDGSLLLEGGELLYAGEIGVKISV